jgi:ligand-binding sensor domain-containing protein/signal transduction histidine kinase
MPLSSIWTRAMNRKRATIFRAGWLLTCTWVCLSGQTRLPNTCVKIPFSEGSDLLFVSTSFGQGPAHGRVGQIVQDHTGFLWFGTKDGLKRYDGYRFRDFRPDIKDLNSLRGVFINALFTDHSGKLWVASDEHLDRYDPATEAFTHFPPRPGLEPPVNDINQDGDGIIWLATSRGLTRLDPITGNTTRFQHKSNDPASLSSDSLRSTLEEKDGTFWVASNIALDLFDRRTSRVVKHLALSNPMRSGARNSANESVHLLLDHAGVLWVASARDGLAMLDRQNDRLIFLALDPGTDPRLQPGALAIYEDPYGTLWVGTNGGGLLKLDHDRRKFVRYRNNPNDPDSLIADQVLALFGDLENGIWVGTGGGGVARIPSRPLPFQRYKHEPGNIHSLATDYVSAVFEDSHGSIWVGSRGEVTRIERKTQKYTRYRIGANEDSAADVLAIAGDRSGDLWFGTRGEGLSRFDARTGQVKVYRHDPGNPSSLSHDSVFALMVDHRGTLWAGTENGLDAYDPETDRFRIYNAPGANPNRERAIAEDATGKLWLATWYAGVQRFDPATGQFTIYRSSAAPGSLSSDAVAAILVDLSGTIWAGTENGLNRFDPATGTFSGYYVHDGLPNDNINGILEDQSGDLWITTSNGLSRFDRRQGVFRNYYRSDGVLGDFTTAWKSPTGEMFFGSYTGLTAFLPDRATGNLYVPPVVLTNFQLSDKSAPIGGRSPLQQSISLTESLTLSHVQSTISFEFAALSYISPQRTRYRYKLERLEKEWSDVDSTQRFARYTTLPPGEYVFRVQSRTSRGIWSDNGAGVRIRILPPWWATWQFRAACILAFGLVLWAGYRLRVRQMAAQLNLRFEERLIERTRIAGELHDTLLQGLLSASMQLDVAADCMAPGSPMKHKLEHILDLMSQVSEEGRKALQGLRSPDNDSSSLEHAFAQIEQEFTRKPSEPEVEFCVIVEGRTQPFHPVLRDELYRIGREAVINAFRHSRAGSIEVELEYSAKQFRLVVRDDGCGMDSHVIQTGREGHWGLPGMRERADRIGAQLRVWSRPERGTRVELTVPGHLAFRSANRAAKTRQFSTSVRRAIRRFVGNPMRLDTRKVIVKDSEER